ncbi:MAG: hypothetical protein KJO07_21615 [Deltaproteobacteria bacterium]|nr:hypothetical protein [Deltaproteobacteria bacterium]
MQRATSRFQEAGARLVVVGNGRANFMEGFRDKSGYQGELYTDPSRATYRALRLKRGLRTAMNVKSVKRAYQAMRAGNRQTATRGDPWQQGGVFIVDRDGTIVYRYPSEFAGDHPPIDDIVAALARTEP